MLIHSTFTPAWWLNNPHLQTIYPTFFRKVAPFAKLQRERLTTPDNDFIDLDWCGTGAKPLVMLLHGLSGSARSNYIEGLQRRLFDMGWRSVALNYRGCSGELNNTARCYHSGETTDLNFIYQTIRRREPETPIAAVGFSLGGNMLLKWLGEQRELDLFAAVAISVPLLLNLCASKLDNGFSKVYRAYLLYELKRYIHDKKAHLTKLNFTQEAEKIAQLGTLHDVKSFWQYDDRVIARLYEFKDVHDYYQRSSSRQFLQHIQVPTLLIQAIDDPFMTSAVIPEQGELSASVNLEITLAGGHVGFISGDTPGKAEYWLEQRIPEYLIQQAEKNGLVI